MSKNHYHDEEDQISSENISVKGSIQEIPSSQKRIRWYRLATIGFVVVTLIALVIGLSMSFLGTPNPFRWFQHGVAPSVNDTARWETYGFSGLELTVENALEDRWTPYFQEYIAQWDQGTPDSLKLSTTRVSTDSSCQPSLGVVKVCNGDYGDTDWLGVTFNLIQDGVIVLSTIKLNDHHLDGMNDDDRKYTMCHELGHSFGLPHTDENYHNANLRNCLDYTMKVSGNLSPGVFNYNLLAEVYGTIPPVRRRLLNVPTQILQKYQLISDEMSEKHKMRCSGIKCIEGLDETYRLVVHKLLVRNLQ